MKRLSLVCVVGLAIGATTCGQTPSPADQTGPTSSLGSEASAREDSTGPVATSAVREAAQPATDRDTDVTPTALPSTGSPLLTIGAAGVLALAGGLGIRGLRR